MIFVAGRVWAQEELGAEMKCVPSFWGLWSKDRGFARPLTPKTLRESPAFAWIAFIS